MLEKEEKPEALKLIWEVFSRFEAPDYSQEGISSFREILDDSEYINERDFYGAFDGKKNGGRTRKGKNRTHKFLFC